MLGVVVVLLVANAVQNGIIGNDVSVAGAVLGAFVVFALITVFARGVFRSSWLAALLVGEPSFPVEPRVLRRGDSRD